jgi:hypothetical protein
VHQAACRDVRGRGARVATVAIMRAFVVDDSRAMRLIKPFTPDVLRDKLATLGLTLTP